MEPQQKHVRQLPSSLRLPLLSCRCGDGDVAVFDLTGCIWHWGGGNIEHPGG